ncbi:hypothetical protein [Streptomyces sp. NBC_00073]|uniref:hypothetical protein n=1 Tax=Streptomyces sp. NBC_00073 TaxID=2975640 RepID=UPI003245EA3E
MELAGELQAFGGAYGVQLADALDELEVQQEGASADDGQDREGEREPAGVGVADGDGDGRAAEAEERAEDSGGTGGARSRTWERRTRRAMASPPPQTMRGWLPKMSRRVTVQVTAAENPARVRRGTVDQGAALRRTRVPEIHTAACGGWAGGRGRRPRR